MFYEICYVCSEENAYVLHNEALNPDFPGFYFSADSSFASLYIYNFVVILGIIHEYFMICVKCMYLPICRQLYHVHREINSCCNILVVL
jgi:hypothetical protein